MENFVRYELYSLWHIFLFWYPCKNWMTMRLTNRRNYFFLNWPTQKRIVKISMHVWELCIIYLTCNKNLYIKLLIFMFTSYYRIRVLGQSIGAVTHMGGSNSIIVLRIYWELVYHSASNDYGSNFASWLHIIWSRYQKNQKNLVAFIVSATTYARKCRSFFCSQSRNGNLMENIYIFSKE